MSLHTFSTLSTIGTFLSVAGGLLLGFWKGFRWLDRFIDSVLENTRATQRLTSELSTLSTQTATNTTQTAANTAQLADLSAVTEENTTAIKGLDQRVDVLEKEIRS